MASSAGAAAPSAAASPPHMNASVPAAAPVGPPLTGQSRYATPRSAQRAARSRATAGAMVLISTSRGAGAAAPSIAVTTSTTSGESVTQEQAISAPLTASAMDAATVTGRPSARDGVRVNSRTSCPAAARLRIMPEPMRPAPTKPMTTRPR